MPWYEQLGWCPECPNWARQEAGNLDLIKIPVPGDGPWDAEIAAVGEGPGREENNRHRPFMGKTGMELKGLYLPLAGLDPDDVYKTNTCKCHWADSSDPPPPNVAKSCAEYHLRRELARMPNLKTVILMGGVANALLGLDVDMEHGMYRAGISFLARTVGIYSTYHPALGIHKSSSMQALVEDFRALKGYLSGHLQPLKIREFTPHYEELCTAKAVKHHLGKRSRWLDPLAIDTESVKRWRGYPSTVTWTPFCATFAYETHTAYMVKLSRPAAWREFARCIQRFHRIIMQNAPHDWWILAQAGARLLWRRITDTMSMSYRLGNLPKGLKPMSYRLLQHRMTSFDEIVVPYGYRLAVDYLQEAVKFDWPKPVQVGTGDSVVRNCPECKGKGFTGVGRGKMRRIFLCDCDGGKVTVERMTRKQGLNDKLNRIVGDLLRQDDDIKIWDRWNKWEEDNPGTLEPLIQRLGPIPIPSIDQVPAHKALVYACGDAANTLAIAPILAQRMAELRRGVRD